MKRYILFLDLFLFVMTVQSQVLINVNGDKHDFNNNLISIKTAGNTKLLFQTDGTTHLFDIRDISSLDFASSYNDIKSVDCSEILIAYDEKAEKVVAINGTAGAVITIYDSNGIQVKKVCGNEVCISELAPGLYIVNYNRRLNAKILKQ